VDWTDILSLVIFIAVWYALVKIVLPKLGVHT